MKKEKEFDKSIPSQTKEGDIKIKKVKCCFNDCPGMSKWGILVQNVAPYYAFPEMNKEEWMHLECYIRCCVKKAINRLKYKKNKRSLDPN
jgi:hypothetical protein